jgi:hypothetical protein
VQSACLHAGQQPPAHEMGQKAWQRGARARQPCLWASSRSSTVRPWATQEGHSHRPAGFAVSPMQCVCMQALIAAIAQEHGRLVIRSPTHPARIIILHLSLGVMHPRIDVRQMAGRTLREVHLGTATVTAL